MGTARAFWVVAYTLGVMIAGSSVPTPLYVLYQDRFGFSPGVLTTIFAVYVIGVITALLVVGRLSDQVGRRPVLLASLALMAVGIVLFVFAQGVIWLVAARVVQGLAIGSFTGTATASLTELHTRGDARHSAVINTTVVMSGIASGSLLGGILVRYAPLPTVLVYLVLLALLIPALVGIWAMPETVQRTTAPVSWRPQRLLVPKEVGPVFAIASAVGFCSFAVVGLFVSLAPSVVVDLLRIHNLAIGGAVVALMSYSSAVAQLVSYRLSARTVIGIGMIAIALGLLLVELSIPFSLLALLLVGAVVVGIGSASSAGGAGLLNRAAPAVKRGEVMSSFYVICYLGMALPALGVGFAADSAGLFTATVIFAVFIGVIALGTGIVVARAKDHTDPAR